MVALDLKTLICPCGSGLLYSGCCADYHTGMSYPKTPKALLRSRYSAFVLLDEAYLQLTWRPRTRPLVALDETQHRIRWNKLVIMEGKRLALNKASILFEVHYALNNEQMISKELSYFIKEGGRWLYDESISD